MLENWTVLAACKRAATLPTSMLVREKRWCSLTDAIPIFKSLETGYSIQMKFLTR